MNVIKIKLVLFFLLFNLIHLQAGINDTLYLSDYLKKGQRDVTPSMLKLIDMAKQRPGAIISIGRGTYHFYNEKAFEKYYDVANHDASLKRTAFPLMGLKNTTIVGDNAMLIFHGLMVPFIIDCSEGISLKGFSIDWEVPLYSEMEIVAVDDNECTFDLAVKCTYEIRNNELIFLKEGYEHNLGRAEFWDPKTGAVAFNRIPSPETRTCKTLIRNGEQLTSLYPPDPNTPINRFRGTEISLFARELTPGLIRISGHKGRMPRAGWILVCKGETSLNRMAPAIVIKNSRKICLKNVTVHHAGGMGLICERTENIEINGFNVALRKGSERTLTTTADATHFVNCKGLIKMNNCLFENMLDDATNVHGVWTRVAELIDSVTVGVNIGHFEQTGFDFAQPGDLCGFVKDGKSLLPILKAEAVEVKKINSRYYIIKFNEKLKDIEAGDLIENLDWYPELEISGCTIRNNRARGFLLGTPKRIICENNYFSSVNSAIRINGSFSGKWYESGVVKECFIWNNYFADNAYGGGNVAVIAGDRNKSEDQYLYTNIVIQGNIFKTFNPYILDLSGIEYLTFKNNRIEISSNYPLLYKDNPVLNISDVKYEDISGNQIPQGVLLKGIVNDPQEIIKFNLSMQEHSK